MTNPISAFAVRLHQAVIEPALVFALRASRLRLFGLEEGDMAELPVEWRRQRDCRR